MTIFVRNVFVTGLVLGFQRALKTKNKSESYLLKERISWSGVLRMKYWVTQNSFLLSVLNFEYYRLKNMTFLKVLHFNKL